MSDITANVVVSMPSQLFTMARSFKAVANGKIYIGKIDTDPVNPENQIQVYVENEDGSHVPVSQPIIINAAGYPVYNGQIAKFVTVQGHSMAVYDAYGARQFYFPNVLKYDPDQLKNILLSKFGASNVFTSSGDSVQTFIDNYAFIYAVDYLPENYVTDGSVDYRAEIQEAINHATSIKSALVLPPFQCKITPVDQFDVPGLLIPSNSIIINPLGGSLKIGENSFEQYGVMTFSDVENIIVINPVCIGDKTTHKGLDGEFGMCFFIRGGCNNIEIKNPKAIDAWGDGIFIGQHWPDKVSYPKKITITRPVTENCRRQGISITCGESIVIDRPELNNTGDSDSTPLPNGPWAGIDIEPNYFQTPLRGIHVNGVIGKGNKGPLTQIALNMADTNIPPEGGRYDCQITIDGVSDDSSRGAFEFWGGPNRDSLFNGYVSVKNVCSKGALKNPIMISNQFYKSGLRLLVDNVSINDWSCSYSSNIDKAPIAIKTSDSSQYPSSTLPVQGNFEIRDVSLCSSLPAESISKYAIVTNNAKGFVGAYISFKYVICPVKLTTNVFGRINLDLGSFYQTLTCTMNPGETLNLASLSDIKMSEPGEISLPSSIDSRFNGQQYRLMYDSSSGFMKMNTSSLNVFVNGKAVTAGYANFYPSAGVISITVGVNGFVLINTQGGYTPS